ncbi:MAG: hypothetical protein NZL92_11665 [Gloeomargarita sp. SKYG116]|nr:hypothetical protein [Gloeomargarita sp. SKYG116]MCS7226662.1 hypothetical protein [Gloeomargarita sp. SKYB31]MDW8402340.1 hypothetical protein [Gloeomargarita sp. SKYGB_i_bin116]
MVVVFGVLPMVNVFEFARRTGIPVWTVFRMVRDGDMPPDCYQRGVKGQVLIDYDRYLDYLVANQATPVAVHKVPQRLKPVPHGLKLVRA